jgi:acetyl-CoA acetyltransferase
MHSVCRLVLLCAVVGWLSPPACSLFQKVEPVIATVADCADQVTHKVALGIVDDVSAILVCDASSTESLPACVLAQLAIQAKKSGWAAVDCVIAEIKKTATSNALASKDETELLRANRAAAVQDWRAHPDGGT